MKIPCKNFDMCHQWIERNDRSTGGRHKEYHSDACRQAVSRRNRGNGPQPQKQNIEKKDTEADQLLCCNRGNTISSPALEDIFNHQIAFEQGRYHCKICGWSWREKPTRSCPKVHMYSERTKPEYLFTLIQLQERALRPGDKPDAVVYRRKAPGWACLYDIRKAQPDPVTKFKTVKVAK